MNNIEVRINKLKKLKGLISKKTIKTLRGQLLSGDVDGFDKGLQTITERYGLDI